MAMAASAMDLQRCTMCCCGLGCSSNSSNSSSELSTFPTVGGLPKVFLRKRSEKKQLTVIRSLYSSLVEDSRPPTMSVPQGFSSHVRRSMSHSVEGAVGHPVNMAKLPGSMGFAMALAVAALGLKTAVAKQAGFLPQGSPQKVCDKCEGYGVQQCHVCQGRGVLNWEGKLRRIDPCPLCFGSCFKKCSNCGGAKMKKGIPPAMVSKLQLKDGASRI